MTPEQFAYWLQGFAELTGGAAPTAAQWKMIQDHLNIVFNKVTLKRPETSQGQREKSMKDLLEEAIREGKFKPLAQPGFPGTHFDKPPTWPNIPEPLRLYC